MCMSANWSFKLKCFLRSNERKRLKALGIALKLTLSRVNQLIYPQTRVFVMVVLVCVLTQMNYLSKALDSFNTAVVSPIYYVMFTSLTILASVIMFKSTSRLPASGPCKKPFHYANYEYYGQLFTLGVNLPPECVNKTPSGETFPKSNLLFTLGY